MNVKKYTAASMPEVMKTVRSELGNDAVILNSRVVFTGGFLGFFKKKNIEVIAAVDLHLNHEKKIAPKEKPLKQVLPQKSRDDKPLETNQAAVKQADDILKEIHGLKELIHTQVFETAQLQASCPEPIQKVQNWMMEQEYAPSLRKRFTEALLEKWFAGGMKSTAKEIEGFLKEEIKKFLSDYPFGGISFTKKYVNVVGPTGVGKTTTLAKIAADCILNYKKRIAFITTDTYRIAAIEQLKTYAQILNVPIEVCYSIEDFQKAAQKFASCDVVLIDTAGRNFRNKQYVDDLQKVIDFQLELETYLVLALTAKEKDMAEIYQQFSSIPINKFIFTKADETSNFGSMINLVERHNKGVAYITTGQNVPDDMMLATPDAITNLLLGAKNNERSS